MLGGSMHCTSNVRSSAIIRRSLARVRAQLAAVWVLGLMPASYNQLVIRGVASEDA